MRYITHTLTLVLMVIVGFMVGSRYQMVTDNMQGLQNLVAVQKNKISDLRTANSHLTTVVRLREVLEDNKVRLSRASVEEMATRVDQVSRKYGVSPDMIFAVIQTESSFDPLAVSDKGAVGLMQLLPSTAREVAQELNIHWTDDSILWDPLTNIEMGTYYLRTLIGRFNSVEVALAAYNQGPSRIAALQATNAALPLAYPGRVMSFLPARN
jgi:soluble lytic murein transglycosylase-like protein